MTDNTQQLLRDWITRILDEKRWSMTRLASEANTAVTTITRIFHDDYTGVMNASTIAKISRATGIAAPGNMGGIDTVLAFREPEVMPLISDEGPAAPNLSEWSIKTSALVLAGYVAGDHITVDDRAVPVAGDAVLAQVYNNERGTAETVVRLWYPPYLTTASVQPEDRKPILVDGEAALIRGVAIKSVRTRKA